MKIYSLKAENKKYDHPILFIHGLMQAAWVWDKYYMPYFQKQGFDVYSLDLTNHGNNQTNKSLKFLTIADYVTDVKEVLAEIGEDCILLGHSMGGMVVQKYLVNNKCHKAILLAPVPPKGVINVVLTLAKRYPFRFLMSNLKMSLLPIVGDFKTCQNIFFGYTIDKDVLEESYKKVQDDSFFTFLGIIFPFLKKAKYNVKTLVVGAADDNAIPSRTIEQTAKFHNGTHKVFEKMAHAMMLEKEWQKPADYIINWILSDKK